MTTNATRPTITDENEMVIEFHDTKSDNLGRRRFTAYWLADNIGPGCDEHGVRGQEFSTDIAAFLARQQRRGRTVRTFTAEVSTRETLMTAPTARPLMATVDLPSDTSA